MILAALAVSALACRREPAWNVLLVTFDTTRSDRLGCYGRARAHTPNVDGLARDGIRFADAYSSVPLTAPSHSSILTGMFPPSHGVRDNSLFVLAPEQLTLAEVLRAQGYRTGAAIGGFPLVARFGLDQGFEFYDDRLTESYTTVLGTRLGASPRLFYDERKAGRVNEAVWSFLDGVGQSPFFLWVHYYDPHQPHQAPPPWNELLADDGYDAEIAYADESLGRLLDRLRELGLDQRTLIVFASDHGEGLGEHDEATHSYLLYDSTLRVPLIIRPPLAARSADPWRGREVHGRVRLVDIFPTVLELLRRPPVQGVQGRSLVSLFAADGSPRPHYAETLSPRLSQNWGELRALLDGPYKYVHGPRPELFDLVEDPRELHDLVNERPQLAATLRDKLSGFLIANRPAKPGRTSAVDEETRQRLLALGYLSGGAGGETEIHEELRSDGLAPQDRAGDLSVVSEARQLLNAGNALAARELARLLVANAPEDPFYNEILASAEAQLGNFEEATAAVDSIGAGGQRASGAKLLLHIAAAQLAKGDAAAARRNLERSLAIHSGAEAHYLLAILLARGGDAAGESREFDAALAVDAKFAPARVDRAVRRAERGDTAGAEEDLLRALADAPYYPVAAYNYGTFLLRRGDRSAALSRFRRAVILEPSYLRAHLAVVALLVDGGDRNGAEAAIAALERVAPNSPESEQARRFLETMK